MNGNTAMIIEYYCSNSKYKNGNYTCNNGCANNACIPDATTTTATCSDSDGGDNIYTKGIVSTIESTGKSHTYTDTCFMNGNTAMIKEYYCSGTKYQSTNHTCNNGCANNACIEDIPVSPPEDTTLTPPKSSGGHSSPSITGNAIVLYCGDHICTVGKENCSTCSTDCGSCPKTTQIIRPNDNNDSAQQQILKAADNAVSGGLEKTNELSGLLIKEDHNTKTLANTVFMMVFMTIFGGIVFFAIRKSLSI
jgi:hypothetical protein